MKEEEPTSKRLPVPPDGGSERRFARRFRTGRLGFRADFDVKGRTFPGNVINMSAIGLQVDFDTHLPPLSVGSEVSISFALLERAFTLQGVVRRIDGTQVAFWLPDVVSGDSLEGLSLQELVQRIASEE